MASPSSSSPSSRYDVFLSFRGKDTRRNFVSFLEKALARKGIMTFNDEYLPIGESVSLRLQAIHESRIAVVVRSEGYASSGWCLDELAKIMECREKRSLRVIPIFYKVNPSSVRREKGKVGADMKEHEEREHPEKVRRWRDALTQLANLSGYDSLDWEDDAKLINAITNNILDMLIATNSSSDLSGLVGMDTHMKALNGFLELESDEVHAIGIFGIPGIGKTSLASYIYQKISSYFDTSFFLENVKKIYKDHGGLQLQEQLQLKYLQEGAVTERIPSGDSDVIRSWLKQRRVLLVVDDVDNVKQLGIVAKDAASWFGARSKIIITTRKKSVLEAYGVKDVYEVKRLCHSDALQLFSYFAFKQIDPPVGFEHLSYRAVELSRGLPLALITLGSTLSGVSEGNWEKVLHRIGRSLAEGITETNESSFAELDEEDKSIASHILNLLISTTLGDLDVSIGMDRHMKEMYNLLDLKYDGVRMIGIWGMEGVGKTTLANYVYEEISPYFPNRCFLKNVRKMYQDRGPSGLQEELLLKTQEKKLSKGKSSTSSNVVKERVGGQKVLLVIDGVDKIEQLEAVAKEEVWFGQGSRVIVTTEDRSLLAKYGIEHSYEVQRPRYDEALQLFCQFAFRQERPSTGFERLSTRAVHLASRLPLALKIFGSLLHGKGKEEWESTLHALEASLKKDTVEILKAMKV